MSKKLLTSLMVGLLILVTIPCWAGRPYNNFWFQVQDEFGAPVTDWTSVTVMNAGTTNTATIYATDQGTSLTNPILVATTSNGVVVWYGNASTFDVKIIKSGHSTITSSGVTVYKHSIVMFQDASATAKNFTDVTDASSLTAASVVLSGGLAVTKQLYIGDDIDMSVSGTGVYDITLKTNVADALSIVDSVGDLMKFVTTTGSQSITITPATTFSGTLTTSAADAIVFSVSGGKIADGSDNTTIYGGNATTEQLRLRGNTADAGPILYVIGDSRVYIAGKLQVSERVYLSSSLDLVQGQYFYLDGDGGAVNIRAHVANGMTINAPTALLITSNNTVIGTTGQLNFRDTGISLNSPNDGKLVIVADGAQNTAISLSATDAAGGICLNGASVVFSVASFLDFTTAGTGSYGMKLKDGVSDAFSIYHEAGDIMVFDTTSDIVKIVSDGLVDAAKKLYFRDANAYIYSSTANKLNLFSSSTAAGGISLTVGAAGSIKLNGFLNMLQTTDDSVAEGDVWYDSTLNKLQFFNGSVVETVTSSI